MNGTNWLPCPQASRQTCLRGATHWRLDRVREMMSGYLFLCFLPVGILLIGCVPLQKELQLLSWFMTLSFSPLDLGGDHSYSCNPGMFINTNFSINASSYKTSRNSYFLSVQCVPVRCRSRRFSGEESYSAVLQEKGTDINKKIIVTTTMKRTGTWCYESI